METTKENTGTIPCDICKFDGCQCEYPSPCTDCFNDSDFSGHQSIEEDEC